MKTFDSLTEAIEYLNAQTEMMDEFNLSANLSKEIFDMERKCQLLFESAKQSVQKSIQKKIIEQFRSQGVFGMFFGFTTYLAFQLRSKLDFEEYHEFNRLLEADPNVSNEVDIFRAFQRAVDKNSSLKGYPNIFQSNFSISFHDKSDEVKPVQISYYPGEAYQSPHCA